MPSKAASSDKLAGQLMLVCAIAFSIAFVTFCLRTSSSGSATRPARSACKSATPIISGCRRQWLRSLPRVPSRSASPEFLLVLVGLAFLVNAGVGVYHAGVEWKWWAGPTSCSGGTAVEWGQGGVAGAIEHPQVVSCSEASWRMLGLSFAGWNAAVSGLLAAIAAYGATLRR